MKDFSILALRLAIGIGLLSAVADRLGFWGKYGDNGVAWGNWNNFVNYTRVLNFNIDSKYASVLGVIVTLAEVLLGIFLIIGFKLKFTAKFSGFLLLVFALMMSINTTIKYALDYSVFVGSFACFLLSCQSHFKWSIDSFLAKN